MRNYERKIKRRRSTGNCRDFPHWSSQDERREGWWQKEQRWRRHGMEGGTLSSSHMCHSLGCRQETAVGSKETKLIRPGRMRQVETAHP